MYQGNWEISKASKPKFKEIFPWKTWLVQWCLEVWGCAGWGWSAWHSCYESKYSDHLLVIRWSCNLWRIARITGGKKDWKKVPKEPQRCMRASRGFAPGLLGSWAPSPPPRPFASPFSRNPGSAPTRVINEAAAISRMR